MAFSPNIKLLFFFSMQTLLLYPAELNKKTSNKRTASPHNTEYEIKHRAQICQTLEKPRFMTGTIEHPWTANRYPWCEGSQGDINTYITMQDGRFHGFIPLKIKHNNEETRILAPLHRAATIQNSCEKNLEAATIRHCTNETNLENCYVIEKQHLIGHAQDKVEALMESQYWAYWHQLFKKGDSAREVLYAFIPEMEIINCISSYIPTAYGYKTVLNIHLIAPDEAPYPHPHTDKGIPLIDYRCLKNPPVCFPKTYIEYKYSITSRVDFAHVKKFISLVTHHYLPLLKKLGTRPLERILSFAGITTHLDQEGCLASYRLLYHSYNDSEDVAPLNENFHMLERELFGTYSKLHEEINRRNYRIAQKAEKQNYREARRKIINGAITELIAASSLGFSGRQTNGNQPSIT